MAIPRTEARARVRLDAGTRGGEKSPPSPRDVHEIALLPFTSSESHQFRSRPRTVAFGLSVVPLSAKMCAAGDAGLRKAAPAKGAAEASSSSMRRSWLYLRTRTSSSRGDTTGGVSDILLSNMFAHCRSNSINIVGPSFKGEKRFVCKRSSYNFR